MHIGEIIRKYRKNRNMTQQEMANRLGVTAPAVNKWENGSSFPDIMTLAPIARLLNISLDTLLSFHGELTEEEISNIVYEVDEKLKKETYEEAFQWAKDKLEQYPNCEQLIWQIALILDVQRLTKDISEPEKYDNYITSCYVRALESHDENIQNSAADSLFGFYLRKEQYEMAEKYLSYFSKQNPERKGKQAIIYSKTNRKQEAYKAYEELLFSYYQMLSVTFHGIYMLSVQDKDMEKAHILVEKQRELASIFEMGEYYEASCELDLATVEEDIETTIATMKQMLSSVDRISDFCKSPLYEHIAFKQIRNDFVAELKNNLLNCFRDEESYSFLKGDKRWQELFL